MAELRQTVVGAMRNVRAAAQAQIPADVHSAEEILLDLQLDVDDYPWEDAKSWQLEDLTNPDA